MCHLYEHKWTDVVIDIKNVRLLQYKEKGDSESVEKWLELWRDG